MQEPNSKQNRLSYAAIGAAIEVHKELGPGLDEILYEQALCVELSIRGIPYERQVPYDVFYKGTNIGKKRIDMLVDGNLLLELKAVDELAAKHEAQLISYLKITKLPLGLLMNFNVLVMKNGIKRIVVSDFD